MPLHNAAYLARERPIYYLPHFLTSYDYIAALSSDGLSWHNETRHIHFVPKHSKGEGLEKLCVIDSDKHPRKTIVSLIGYSYKCL